MGWIGKAKEVNKLKGFQPGFNEWISFEQSEKQCWISLAFQNKTKEWFIVNRK
jgi:hypothetical protein